MKLSPKEGAGNAGRPMRPQAACAMVVVESTRVSQVTPESPGIPARNGFNGFLRAPRRPGFLATVACGLASANLTPASGCQDHTTSPSASAPFVRKRIRVHRIPPRVRDVAQRPSLGQDGASCRFDLPDAESEIFLRTGLDRQNPQNKTDLPVGQIKRRARSAREAIC